LKIFSFAKYFTLLYLKNYASFFEIWPTSPELHHFLQPKNTTISPFSLKSKHYTDYRTFLSYSSKFNPLIQLFTIQKVDFVLYFLQTLNITHFKPISCQSQLAQTDRGTKQCIKKLATSEPVAALPAGERRVLRAESVMQFLLCCDASFDFDVDSRWLLVWVFVGSLVILLSLLGCDCWSFVGSWVGIWLGILFVKNTLKLLGFWCFLGVLGLGCFCLEKSWTGIYLFFVVWERIRLQLTFFN
jgi:hypothetical protein